MDYIRTCYRVKMRLGPGREPVWVRWYWAPGGAQPMPVWTPFGSRDWESREASAEPELGEQGGTRQWLEGSVPTNAVGLQGSYRAQQCATEHADWWQGGFTVGEESGPYDAQGRPICCLPEPDSPCGGCDCAAVTTDMVPDVVQWAAECFFLGNNTNLAKTGTCEWSGTWFTWSGDFTHRMYHDGTLWHWEIDTSPPCHFTAAGDTCLPISVDFSIPDLPTQPFALGIPCPGDKVLRFINNG